MQISKPTLLWYDLETFGLNTRYDRIAQFAAQRTDMELNPIGDSIVLYGKVSDDYLPDPLACLLTGITPSDTEKGLCEYELIQRINKEFSVANTTVCGFNNINFDDEMIRSALYRNFFDPYEREWKNGCSRWDIIDLVRAAHDLRPEGILWPPKNPENGNPVFRLTELTKANNIEQKGAHDAMVDVNATIAIARLLKNKQPKLYDYYFKLRKKEAVKQVVRTPFGEPVLYTASRFTNPNGCSAMIVPLTPAKDMSNSFLCFDLSKDPTSLFTATSEQIKATDGLFLLATNRCPFVTAISPVFPDEGMLTKLGINKTSCMARYNLIKEQNSLILTLREISSKEDYKDVDDTDFEIYSGGFFSDFDKNQFILIHQAQPGERLSLNIKFQDKRVFEMLFRHIGRNYPEVLTEEQQRQWKSFCANRILNPPGNIMINWDFFNRKITERMESNETEPKQKLILSKLKDYKDKLALRIFS